MFSLIPSCLPASHTFYPHTGLLTVNILESIFYPKIFPYAFFVFYIFGLSTMSLVYPELTFTYITKHCVLLLYVWISSCCRVIIYPLNSFIKKQLARYAVGGLTASDYPPTGMASYTIYVDVEHASGLLSSCGIGFLISISVEDSDLWVYP